jgi:hypothetical protein
MQKVLSILAAFASAPLALAEIKIETISLPMRDAIKLTSRHLGRDYRLTGVYGEVVKEILA